jgi:hypothetical protein
MTLDNAELRLRSGLRCGQSNFSFGDVISTTYFIDGVLTYARKVTPNKPLTR